MKYLQLIRALLTTLFLLLIVEGLIRKVFGSSYLNILLFFGKDAICIALAVVLVLRRELRPLTRRVLRWWMILLVALAPCLLVTLWYDWKLAVFGLKQYALFFVTLPAVVEASSPDRAFHPWALRLAALVGMLVVPTTVLAILQSKLPFDHWINRGVGGMTCPRFPQVEVSAFLHLLPLLPSTACTSMPYAMQCRR